MEDSKQKVILQIIPSLESGGVERGTIDIAKSLKKQNFSPIVISSGGVLTYDLKEAKINFLKEGNSIRVEEIKISVNG